MAWCKHPDPNDGMVKFKVIQGSKYGTTSVHSFQNNTLYPIYPGGFFFFFVTAMKFSQRQKAVKPFIYKHMANLENVQKNKKKEKRIIGHQVNTN
jgi:hypothetical protein